MVSIRKRLIGAAGASLAAGALLALAAPAGAATAPYCESGTSIVCQAPSDAASGEVWQISPYPSMAYSSSGWANASYINVRCTSTDQIHHTYYYFTVTYTSTSGSQVTSGVGSAQCLTITP